MMRWAGAHKRADEFAAAVDDRRASVSTRPDGGPATSSELQAFVEIVSQLRDLKQPTLRSDFATDLRARLMAEAPEELAATSGSSVTTRPRRDAAIISFPASPRRRTATAAAAVCIVLGSTAGVAAASQTALPGEALYPVKRGIEHVQAAIAGSQHAKGSEYLDQASTRLDEVTDLTVAHADDPSTAGLVRQTLEDFADQADDGANALMSSYRQDQNGSSIAELRRFTDESADRLDALTSAIPSEASGALADAATLLSQLDQEAQALCPVCSALPIVSLSSALLDLQLDQTTLDPTAPGSLAPTPDPKSPTGTARPTDGPTDAVPTISGSSPGGAVDPTDASATIPTFPVSQPDNGPTGSSTQQPGGVPVVTVPGPNGGDLTIGTSVPTVPLPTGAVDLPDPGSSVPQVIDDVTSALPDLP